MFVSVAIAPVVQTARTALSQASNQKAVAAFTDASTNVSTVVGHV